MKTSSELYVNYVRKTPGDAETEQHLFEVRRN